MTAHARSTAQPSTQEEPAGPPPVTVVGLGASTPFGDGVDALAGALAQGRSAMAAPRGVLDPASTGFPVCEIDSDPEAGTAKYVVMGVAAAQEALAQSGLHPADIDLVVVGTTIGPRPGFDWVTGGRVPPRTTIEGDDAMSAGTVELARVLGIDAACLTVSTACSSGAGAVALAWQHLRVGEATTALVIGIDEFWHALQMSFELIQALSKEGCSPFGRSDGTTVGEGAGAVVLSTRHDQRAVAVVAGVGQSADAYHPARPDPSGAAQFLAVERALEQAGSPRQLHLIAGHGTGTRANDRMERALSELVEQRLGAPVPMFSAKGLHGHTSGASGVLELIELVLALDGRLDLGAVSHLGDAFPAPPARPWVGMKNAFSMGGLNSSIVVASPDWRPAKAARPLAPTRVTAALTARDGGVAAARTDHEGRGNQRAWSVPELTDAALDTARCRRLRWDTFDPLSVLVALGVAGLMAVDDLDAAIDRDALGLIVSTELGPARIWRELTDARFSGMSLPAKIIPNLSRHASATNSADLFGIRGPVSTLYQVPGRPSSALSSARALVGSGCADVVIVVEVEDGTALGDGVTEMTTTDGHTLRACVVRRYDGLALARSGEPVTVVDATSSLLHEVGMPA